MTNQKKDSFIVYRSFIEAINDLPDKNRLEVYDAISSYSLDEKEQNLTGISKTIFTLIKPQLDANHKKFINGCKGAEYGKLGGRPKTKTPKKPLKNPKETPNVNDNVNVECKLKNENKIIIPDFIDADLWNDYLKMRVKAKAPNTERAIKLLVKDLTNFENKKRGNANISLENSIKNNWKGVFEPKESATTTRDVFQQFLNQDNE